VRETKGITGRDDSITSGISLRTKAAPNFRHHYKRWEENCRMVLWEQLSSHGGRQADPYFRPLSI